MDGREVDREGGFVGVAGFSIHARHQGPNFSVPRIARYKANKGELTVSQKASALPDN